MTNVDVSQLNRLVSDLSEAPTAVQRQAYPVVKKGAQNVKEGMARDFSGHAHAPHAPRAIDYDMRFSLRGSIEAEIGFNKSKPQGALGNILAFGTSKNAPVADIGASLTREGPNFEKALADIAAKALT